MVKILKPESNLAGTACIDMAYIVDENVDEI